MLRDTTTRNTLSKITCTRFPERSLQDSCFDARDRHDDRVTRRTVRSRSFRSFDVGRPRIGRGIIHLESEVERSEPITTPFSSFTISRCVQKDVEEKGEGESDDEERKDEGSGLGLILSLSSLLVPSIEPDKGKRRLAFSSTLSTLAVSFVLSLSLFLPRSLFSPSYLTLAAALQLSATHAPPSLPPSELPTTTTIELAATFFNHEQQPSTSSSSSS